MIHEPIGASFPSGLLVDGQWLVGEPTQVIDKYRQIPFAGLSLARPEDVDAAVGAAVRASRENPLAVHSRYSILKGAADYLALHEERVIKTYVAETGFTIRDALTELNRARETLVLCAEEAKRLFGETIPVEGSAGSENRIALTLRTPIGVVCAISPFNAPLNTVAHKVGPALAAGNAVVLKPSSAAPICSVLLAEALMASGLPPGYLNLVVGPGPVIGERLVGDRRIGFYTFTGSTKTGLAVKRGSGISKTHLELGSNSVTLVCADADLDLAAELIVRGGFRKAGQVCTSVQRVLVDQRVTTSLSDRLAARVERLVVGDPMDRATDVGPMISVSEAERALAWVTEAIGSGARLVSGGTRKQAVMWPTILANVTSDARVMCEEVFAPVVSLFSFGSLDQAVEVANSSRYGLQAGVFTQDLDRAFDLARRLDVGGVVVNDTSSYHADMMPFGGVKESGYGLEGPRYAVMEMTNPKLIVLNLRPERS